jgi:hypothetical protein
MQQNKNADNGDKESPVMFKNTLKTCFGIQFLMEKMVKRRKIRFVIKYAK